MLETQIYWQMLKEKILALDIRTKVLIGLIMLLLISMIWTSLKTFGILVAIVGITYLIYWLYIEYKNRG